LFFGTNVAYLTNQGDNMPLEVKLTPKLTYKLRLSPQIKLALNLLQLPLAQLKEYVKQEIEKNPLLEPSEDRTAFSKEKLDGNLESQKEFLEKIGSNFIFSPQIFGESANIYGGKRAPPQFFDGRYLPSLL